MCIFGAHGNGQITACNMPFAIAAKPVAMASGKRHEITAIRLEEL